MQHRMAKKNSALAIALAIAGSIALPAFADDRQACIDGAEQSQMLRADGRYRAAREQLLVCARAKCPGVVRADCEKWLADLEREAPTVVLGAKNETGADVLDVKVSMDGAPLITSLDGKPTLVDSGEHTFVFEDASGARASERIVVRAAEKARPLVVTLRSPAKIASTPSPGAKRSLVPGIVAAGVGVIGLASFTFFGLSASSDVDDLKQCKPRCPSEQVDDARTKLVFANVSLGVGIVSAGVAAALLWIASLPTSASVRSWSVDGGALPGGGYAGISGRFR